MNLMTAAGYTQSRVSMDTVVSIEICDGDASHAELETRTRRALGWFDEVERRCNRFDDASELRRLCSRPGEAVSVSPLLFNALEFAVSMAEASGGAFDPTIGHAMQSMGFNRNYRSGEVTAAEGTTTTQAGYRSIRLDREHGTVTLEEPLLLDLNAVAKGLAIDLAATELQGLAGFAVNAGGDIRVGGLDGEGERWRIGVRHPRHEGELLTLLALTDTAICTSGDYERPTPDGSGHHLIDPITGAPVSGVASVTVVAPTAMMADALSTAAFALGPRHGLRLIRDAGVEGLIVTPAMESFFTPGMKDLHA